MWMHKHKVKHRTRGTQGHELYFAYLPLVAVRDPATSEVWRCFGFPVEASLDSGSDSAQKVSARPWSYGFSFALKQERAQNKLF